MFKQKYKPLRLPSARRVTTVVQNKLLNVSFVLLQVLKLPPPEPEKPPSPPPPAPVKRVLIEDPEIIDSQFLRINVRHITGMIFYSCKA